MIDAIYVIDMALTIKTTILIANVNIAYFHIMHMLYVCNDSCIHTISEYAF